MIEANFNACRLNTGYNGNSNGTGNNMVQIL